MGILIGAVVACMIAATIFAAAFYLTLLGIAAAIVVGILYVIVWKPLNLHFTYRQVSLILLWTGVGGLIIGSIMIGYDNSWGYIPWTIGPFAAGGALNRGFKH